MVPHYLPFEFCFLFHRCLLNLGYFFTLVAIFLRIQIIYYFIYWAWQDLMSFSYRNFYCCDRPKMIARYCESYIANETWNSLLSTSIFHHCFDESNRSKQFQFFTSILRNLVLCFVSGMFNYLISFCCEILKKYSFHSYLFFCHFYGTFLFFETRLSFDTGKNWKEDLIWFNFFVNRICLRIKLASKVLHP